MRMCRIVVVLFALEAGCVLRGQEAPSRATRKEDPAARPVADAPHWGFTLDDLERVEALSGAGTVRLLVPRSLWGQIVAALDSAREAEGPGPLAPRSPVLRFALKGGRELTLDLVGPAHWRLVRKEGETPLAPCPALKMAAGVALRLACAAGADLIAVAKVARRAGQEQPVLEVVRTLKGSATAGARLRVEEGPLPSPGGPDALCLAFLRVESDGLGVPRYHRLLPVGTLWEHTDRMEAKVRESIPLPEAWGEAVGGLRLGLRSRESAVEPGGELALDVYIQNVAAQPVTLPQHRMNIYDYYPHTRFRVTLPDGRKCELAKPVTEMDEADAPAARTLQPGEAYIHTVRLNVWPTAAPDAAAGPQGRGTFSLVGRYRITCTYSVPGRGVAGRWAGTLAAPPIEVHVVPERAKTEGPGESI